MILYRHPRVGGDPWIPALAGMLNWFSLIILEKIRDMNQNKERSSSVRVLWSF